TLPIGFGAGAVGAQFGKVAFRSLATRLLVRTGAAGAEAAILAIEEGGVQAIRFGSQAWKALTPQMQRAIILSRVGAGALSVTVEGTLLLGGSTVAEGIITGQSTPITSANLVESIFKALAFRGIGTAGNKIFGNALKAGGSRGMKALIAMESMSGLAGTGIEAASLYAKGHGDFVDTGFVLRSLLENAITSTGMHWAHGKFEGGARKGRNKIEEAYSKQVAEEAPSKLGFDASKPETIKTARVTPDGEVIINGRTMKDFDVHALAHLPKEARQKVLDLNPNSALDTHFKSKFSTEVPKELLPDGDPARANEIHGWIDKDGKIHYNLDHLNAGTSEGGPYRGKKILPEGYTAKVNKKGDLVIAGPNGKDMGLRDFLKTPEGKQSSIMDEMKRIKNHEATHQAIESAYSKMEKGIPIEDSSKTNSVKDMFARPDVDGRIPEGKIPLVDHNGNPMEPTWQNVQEYLCHVGDGSIKVPPELMQHFERVLARQIPGFKFSRARQISTKMLATKPKEAFARTHIAADHVGEPWKKIGSMEDLGSAMKSEKTEHSNYKIAEQLMGDFMSVLRTGDKAQIEMFKDNNSAFIDRKVLDQFESGYQSSVDRLGKKMTTPEGLKELAVLESQGGMNVFDRILSKQLVNEAKLVSDLTSHNHPDGTPKSPQEMAADMQRLKQNIDFGTIELSPLALRHLSATPEGIAFIRYGLRHGHLESFATLPEPVKQKLVSEAHDRSLYRVKKGMESLKEKITKTKEKIDAGEIDDDGGQRKIDDMEARLKAYEKLSRMSKEDFQKAFEKMDTDGHPPGFEEMPKLTELLMGNADKLNVDFMVAMLDGKMKYQEVGTGSGKRKVMYVEGRLLGVGGLGEAWSVAAFEAGAKTPHEMVMKKSKVPPHVDEAMTDFMNLDRDVRYDIDDLVDNFVKVGIKTEGGLNLALKRAKELPLDSHHFQELNSYLSRLQAAHNEAQNVKLIMEHQAKGELTSFTKFHYVTDSNAIFMESIAVPRANYQVCDYEKIMAGDVTSLDGKKPISQKKFWGGLADIMDSIGEAHALGFVHRDIKPENFGIGPDGKIRLIDAGSVKTKASMGKVDYLELPSDPYHLDHTEGRSEYYYPYEGGITLHYYDGSISYHESKGTIDADGKPKVNFGGSDRFAMARSLEEILNTQAEAGKPKWANKEQTQKIRDIIAYLKKPRSDINVAAQRLRDVMAIHD
ncbi:MAG: serine/threonine-protein kinase, partial [Candidatus Gracilibacteria bacterium]